MNKIFLIRILNIMALMFAIIGNVVVIKIPGNVALVPLIIALLLGLIAYMISKSINEKGVFSKVAIVIVIIGFMLYLMNSNEAIVIEDNKQEQLQKENSKTLEATDELDNALDDL